MKVVFWKHHTELFWGGTIIIFLALSFFIIGLIFTILNMNYFPILLVGIILCILALNMFFCEKRTLSKVIYSEEGIEWKWLNKSIDYIKWSEITDVKAISHGATVYNLSFIARDRHIDVGLTKKMYNAIMIVCPEPNIKFQIKSLREFKHLHKNDE